MTFRMLSDKDRDALLKALITVNYGPENEETPLCCENVVVLMLLSMALGGRKLMQA